MHRPYACRFPASTGRRKIVVASTMRARTAPPTMTAMTTTAHEVATSTATGHDDYVLGRTQEEYERLRAQARVWAQATGRLLDQVELARGARCLDAGCGPGETMRQLAQRVGPAGEVVGVDVDAALGAQSVDLLHAAGHRQCSFAPVDLERRDPIPGAPFDLVYARLLLFHVSDPVAVLRRLWDAVAPGGHLSCTTTTCGRRTSFPGWRPCRSGSVSYSARSPARGATSTPDTASHCCSPAPGSAPPTAPTSPGGSSRCGPPARC